jgi:hypothetical protein
MSDHERIKAMTDRTIEQNDANFFADKVSDEALEAAAATGKEKAGSITLAFCSGLDTCPA